MAFTLAEAVVFFKGDDSQLQKDLGGAEKKTESAVGNMAKMFGGALVGGAVAAGTAIAGIGIAGVKSFAEFEGQMNEVFTLLPGLSQSAMGDMTQQVKDFSREFGVLPEEVVPALYQALSAGVPPDNVFDFLATSNKAAAGGVSSLETAVDGISSVINAYGTDVVSASEASDLMFTTVKLGKTNFDELSASLFNVVPTAAALGVGFEEVTAALAAMTLQGVPTSVATTQLRSLMNELASAGSATATAFAEVTGQTFPEFIEGGGDLAGALAAMEKAAANNNVRLSDMFGSVEAGNAALALTGAGAQTFAADLAAMGNATGATETAFQTMESGIGDALGDLQVLWATTMLDIGTALAPVVAELLPGLQAIAEVVSKKVIEFFEAIPPAIDEMRRLWDEDFAGMRTTSEQFATDMPNSMNEMWKEINLIFDTGGEATQTDWESFLGGMLSFVQGWNIFITTEFTLIFRGLRLAMENITALITGDWATFWNGVYEFFNTWADFFLNIVEFTFGADLRDAMVGALTEGWEGMKETWKDISEWWTNAWSSLFGSTPAMPTPAAPNMGIVNPANVAGYQVPAQFNEITSGYDTSQYHGAGFPTAGGGTVNNITVNQGNGSYEQGFATGEGVLDAMRFRGY